MTTQLLVIDDDPDFRTLLQFRIRKEGFTIHEAGDIKTAMQILEHREIQVVLTDIYLPDGNGADLILAVKAAYPCIEVIALTALGRISVGVKSIKNGAFDYVVKEEDNARFISVLHAAAQKAKLQFSINRLEKGIDNYHHEETGNDIITQNAEKIERATSIVKAIQSPLRQRILQFIFTKGKSTVTEIFTTLQLEQTATSQHLAILKSAGLVSANREGKNIYYGANYTGIEKIIVFVQQLLNNNREQKQEAVDS